MATNTKDARDEALIRLMQTYGDGVKRMCCMILRDASAAEDAAQDTFIKAYAHTDTLLRGGIRDERAWLMRIAINTCKDALRSPWRRLFERRKPIEELPLPAMLGCEDSLALTQAIAHLPTDLRMLVLLHYYQGLTLRACAEILGISPPTATRRLAKAHQKLREHMET